MVIDVFFPFHYEPQFSYAVKHLCSLSFLRISFDVDSCYISCLLCIFITCFFFDSAMLEVFLSTIESIHGNVLSLISISSHEPDIVGSYS